MRTYIVTFFQRVRCTVTANDKDNVRDIAEEMADRGDCKVIFRDVEQITEENADA